MAAINEENRGRIMATIRSRDTEPEILLRAMIRSRVTTSYRCHARNLPGRPDIALIRPRLAVFVDGAYWHGHPDFLRSNATEYWKKKIRRNAERDHIVDRELRRMGWEVARFWDFEVMANCGKCVDEINRRLATRRPAKPTTSPVPRKPRA